MAKNLRSVRDILGYIDQYGSNYPNAQRAAGRSTWTDQYSGNFAYNQAPFQMIGQPEAYYSSPALAEGPQSDINLRKYPGYVDQYGGNFPNTGFVPPPSPSQQTGPSLNELVNTDIPSSFKNLSDFAGPGGGNNDSGGFGPSLTGVLGKVGAVLNPISMATDIVGTIGNMFLRYKEIKERAREFDKTFEENKRQFGIEFALKDYATRKGISLNEAAALAGLDTKDLNEKATTENIKTSTLGRMQAATKFKWAKEDHAKQEAYGKALQKGLMMGITGGK